MKRVFFTENQIKNIFGTLNENETKWNIDPRKVLLVKKFLDDWFIPGVNMEYIGEDGFLTTEKLVCMKDNHGNQIKNMDAKQLFELLQTRFKNIYADTEKRDLFLQSVMKNWYKNNISKQGIIKNLNRY